MAVVNGAWLTDISEDTSPQLGGDLDANGHSIAGRTAAQLQAAADAAHTQGTDQKLDDGGANEVTAAQAKSAYTHSVVVSGNPHSLDAADVGADPTGTAASEVGTHESTYSHADIATNSAHTAGDGSDHADVASNSAARHTQGTDQALDTGGVNEITAANAKAAYTHSTGDGSDHADVASNTAHAGTTTGNPHSVSKSDVGLGNVPNTDCTNASNISSGTLASARMATATGAAQGAVELATVAEANAGDDETRAVTAAGLLLIKSGTAYIGGDVSGDARGTGAIDIQSNHGDGSKVASGTKSSAFGNYNEASGNYWSSAFGYNNIASGDYGSSTFGYRNTASGNYGSSTFGYHNEASGTKSTAIGYKNTASGNSSSTFGYRNIASGTRSSAFGYKNEASGARASAIGCDNEASGERSSAIGNNNTALGTSSSAFGYENTASGGYYGSSAFGYKNEASGYYGSSAFGYRNTASGYASSAFGYRNTASGSRSSAIGCRVHTTIANTCEVGYWSNATTRAGAVRMHPSGMVAMTIQERDSAYTASAESNGSEADNTLAAGMAAIRIHTSNGECYLDWNDGGTIRTITLGDFIP